MLILPSPSALPSIDSPSCVFPNIYSEIWLKKPVIGSPPAAWTARIAALVSTVRVTCCTPGGGFSTKPASARAMSTSIQPKNCVPLTSILPSVASRQKSTNPPVPGMKASR